MNSQSPLNNVDHALFLFILAPPIPPGPLEPWGATWGNNLPVFAPSPTAARHEHRVLHELRIVGVGGVGSGGEPLLGPAPSIGFCIDLSVPPPFLQRGISKCFNIRIGLKATLNCPFHPACPAHNQVAARHEEISRVGPRPDSLSLRSGVQTTGPRAKNEPRSLCPSIGFPIEGKNAVQSYSRVMGLSKHRLQLLGVFCL